MLATYCESEKRSSSARALARRESRWTLNALGQSCVDHWVRRNALKPESQSLLAWYRYAEMTANAAEPGEEVVIEMGMLLTRSGYPEELKCRPEWFDRTTQTLTPPALDAAKLASHASH